MITNSRIKEIDALRGIAILMVVFYHYTTRYGELFNHKVPYYLNFSFGYLGVQLFFMISGFVIYMSVSHSLSVKDFVKKRIVRLYPAYIAAIFITYIAVGIYHLEGREVSLSDAIINITMLQGLIPNISSVDGSYWSLLVEFNFYVMIAIAFYFKLLKWVTSLCMLWLGASVVILLNKELFGINLLDLMGVLSDAKYSYLFVSGIMFYLLKKENKVRYHLVIGLCLTLQMYFNTIISNVFVGTFFVVFYALIYNKLSFIDIKYLRFLGTISYALYLIHQNIGYIIINIMEKYGMTNEIYIVIPISIVILLSTLLTFWVEKPMQEYLKSKKGNWQSTKFEFLHKKMKQYKG